MKLYTYTDTDTKEYQKKLPMINETKVKSIYSVLELCHEIEDGETDKKITSQFMD